MLILHLQLALPGHLSFRQLEQAHQGTRPQVTLAVPSCTGPCSGCTDKIPGCKRLTALVVGHTRVALHSHSTDPPAHCKCPRIRRASMQQAMAIRSAMRDSVVVAVCCIAGAGRSGPTRCQGGLACCAAAPQGRPHPPQGRRHKAQRRHLDQYGSI